MTDFVFVHKVSKKYVSKELAKEIHAKAAPFVKWLKEAEEESEGSEEEEEEEDENVEVKHSRRSVYFTILCLSEAAPWLSLSWSLNELRVENIKQSKFSHLDKDLNQTDY